MKITTVLAFLFLATTARAADVYLVQGQAVGPVLGQEMILWSTDVLFLNKGNDVAHVRLIATSNHVSAPLPPTEFAIPPARSTSLGQEVGSRWHLGTNATLWVHHLDVSSDVVMENLLFIGGDFLRGIATPFKYGKVSLPVIRSLTAAGQKQYHLGTYLGTSPQIPSHINVAIYNAAPVKATAHIEVRNHCDDSLIDARDVEVPADTIIQVGGFLNEANCPPSTPIGGLPQAIYTTVTVDQPSFSFVSTLANSGAPTTSVSITE